MGQFPRITFDPDVMGGKACIRGLRVTVATGVGLLAAGRSADEILGAYPYLEREHRPVPGLRRMATGGTGGHADRLIR